MPKRKCKTTEQQYQLYVDELESNTFFRNNKNDPEHPNILETTWNSLTERLNSLGGPANSSSEWKSVFANWKYNIRKKARVLNLAEQQTGKNTPPERPLTTLETKLLNITGKAAVEGFDNLREYGILEEDDSNKENEAEIPIKQPKIIETPKKIPKPQSSNSSHINKLTLTSTVHKLIEKNDMQRESDLKELNNNLVKLINVQERLVDIELMKIKLKYPDVQIDLE